MGIKIDKDGVPFDRNVAEVQLFTATEDPNDWRVVVHFQDSQYGKSGKVIGSPEFGTERIEYRYGDIKDEPLEGGGKVSDLFPKLKSFCYAVRQWKIDDAAEAAKAAAAAEKAATATEVKK